jgi:hypothetical protein
MRAESGVGSGSGASPTTPEWRWALPRIAAIFVATRLLVFAVAIAVEVTQAAPRAGVRWSDAPLLASLTAFDGRYYLGIAASGYHAAPVFGPYVDYHFFPLYPIVVRLLSILTLGDIDVAGVVVANGSFGLALVALYALSIRHLPREAAMRALVFLSLAPGAVAFAMAYTESLFLLLAVGAFLAAETRRPALMGLLFGLATLVRPPGIFLVVPLLVLVLRDPGLASWRARAWLLAGPVALGLFALHLWTVTGDLLAIPHSMDIWRQVVEPGSTTGAGSSAGGTLVGVANGGTVIPTLWLLTLGWYGSLFVFFRRDRMSLTYTLVAVVSLGSIVTTGLLASAPRYLAVAWPFDWTLGLRRSRWATIVVPVVFVGLQCVFAWLAFTWRAAP